MSSFFERVGREVGTAPRGYNGAQPGIGGYPATPFKAKRYATEDDSTYWASPGTAEMLAPAFYVVRHCGQRGLLLVKLTTSTDELLRLPDPVCDMLLAEFVTFWDAVPKLTARGLMAKRGLLLWGPPGSGKTSALQLMAAHMIRELKGVVIVVGDPMLTVAGIHMLRSVEPERPIILVYEDLDALVQQYGESAYLAMLDGEAQISGVVNVATTNYPERLDKRFVDRPGRFDRITECPMPSAEARRAYIAAKAPEIDELTRERWVRATDDLSLGHMRELIVAHIGLGEDDEAVIARLMEMHDTTSSSERGSGRKTVGFG